MFIQYYWVSVVLFCVVCVRILFSLCFVAEFVNLLSLFVVVVCLLLAESESVLFTESAFSCCSWVEFELCYAY